MIPELFNRVLRVILELAGLAGLGLAVRTLPGVGRRLSWILAILAGVGWAAVRVAPGGGAPLVEAPWPVVLAGMALLYLGGAVGIGRRYGLVPAVVFIGLVLLNLQFLLGGITYD